MRKASKKPIKIKGKLMYMLGGKLYAYGGQYGSDDTYERFDSETAGAAVTNQTVSGIATGASTGMSAGPIGAAIGAVVGGIGGAVAGGAEAKKQLQDYEDSKLRERGRREEISRTINNTYPSKGVAGVHSMYAFGGKKMYAMGGNPQVAPQGMQPLASDVQEVQGPSHENGGVPLGPDAEVEGGEVIQPSAGGTNIYSDRLPYEDGMTYADKAAEIGKKKSKFEEKLNSASIFEKGTARREIEKLDGELNKLFQQQEIFKQANGLTNPQEQQPQESIPQQVEAGQGFGQQPQVQQATDQSVEQTMPQQGVAQFAFGGKKLYAVGGYSNGGGPGDKAVKRYKGLFDTQMTDPVTGEMLNDTYGEAGQTLLGDQTDSQSMNTLMGNNNGSTMGIKTKPFGLAGGKGGVKTKVNFGKMAQNALPYIDNVVNAVLTANTPKVPKPVPYRTVPMKTDYNIAPQLAAIDETEANTTQALSRNTADSATLRANIIASKAGLVSSRNQLYGQKVNAENALINADRSNTQQVGNANVDKESQHNMMNFQREGEIQRRISENAANASTDAQMQVREDNLRKRDMLELDLLKQQYKDSGVWNRNIEKHFQDYVKGLTTFEQFSVNVGRTK